MPTRPLFVLFVHGLQEWGKKETVLLISKRYLSSTKSSSTQGKLGPVELHSAAQPNVVLRSGSSWVCQLSYLAISLPIGAVKSINQYELLCQNPWTTHHMAFVLWLAQTNAGPLQLGGDDQSYLPSFVPCDCFLLLLGLVREQVERAEESGLEQQHFWTWQIWLCAVWYWSCKLPSSTCPSCKP